MRAQIASAADILTRWRVELLDLLFPQRCVGCHRIGYALCPDCFAQVPLLAPPLCARCGQSLGDDSVSRHRCAGSPAHLDVVRSAAYHEGAIRKAIHAYKYQRRRDLVVPLVALLRDHLDRRALDFDLVTAVPLHPSRERERGYNQSELLARALARQLGKRFVRGICRTRATADQVGLNVTQRHANVSGAFQATTDAYRDQRVLLIDDVFTTGATLEACAIALQAVGTKAIYGLTVARPRHDRSSGSL